MKPTPEDLKVLLEKLSAPAWKAREHALVHGKTRVGCAVLAQSGEIYCGCNVEHRFRCHDVHAEVNALTSMVTAGGRAKAILIVAERDRFTPCGGCMDWIMELAGQEAIVAFQSSPDGPFLVHTAKELMPYYPE
jgi:cytidine deaminase